MYPCEPFSAAAFMNSASSCFSVSALSFAGDAAERRLETATIASTSATARTGRNLTVFMQPPLTRRTILLHGKKSEPPRPRKTQGSARDEYFHPGWDPVGFERSRTFLSLVFLTAIGLSTQLSAAFKSCSRAARSLHSTSALSRYIRFM